MNNIQDFNSDLFEKYLAPYLAETEKRNGFSGQCYVASEVLFHFFGGKAAGWKPMQLQHEDTSHWFIYNETLNCYIDPTKSQFKTRVPYHLAKGKGFLTKQPSQRAQLILNQIKG